MTGRPFEHPRRSPTADTQIDDRSPSTTRADPVIDDRRRPATRYEVLDELHRGGMGEIFLAKLVTESGFSRRVVLKGLLDPLLADDVSHDLFMREANLMAQLEHPNIVRVFDLPRIQGRPFLAMEHVRGRNLQEVIQRSAARPDVADHDAAPGLPPIVALTVMAQALRGLHSAHCLQGDDRTRLGVVHRDISPGNILMSFHGEVKVTDFGIAKLDDSPAYTAPQTIRGKAQYVAPEQVHGDRASVASDIYSAGVVLAEALMGASLWMRTTVAETLMAIVTQDRNDVLDRVLRDLPEVPGLRATLRKALATAPEDRPASALHFAESLEAVAAQIGPHPSSVDLGLYLRELFAGDADVPEGDGFGRTGLAAVVEKDRLDDERTTAPMAMFIASTPVRPEPNPAPMPALGIVSEAQGPVEGPPPVRSAFEPVPLAHDAPPQIGGLVVGIFVGASLAIVGCLIALSF